MSTEVSYTHLRANLRSLLNRVADDQEIVIVRRNGAADVVLLSVDELASLTETAHPLRSAKNGRRLIAALRRSKRGLGKPESLAELRRGTPLAPSPP